MDIPEDDDVYDEECMSEQYMSVAEISFDLALKSSDSSEWKYAIYSEIENFVEKDVFDLVDRPADRVVIGCRTVLTHKYSPDGNL